MAILTVESLEDEAILDRVGQCFNAGTLCCVGESSFVFWVEARGRRGQLSVPSCSVSSNMRSGLGRIDTQKYHSSSPHHVSLKISYGRGF